MTDEQRVAADTLEQAAKRVLWGWCQHTEARTADDRPVRENNARARKWGACGALLRECYNPASCLEPHFDYARFSLARSYLMYGLEQRGLSREIAAWNDAPTQTKNNVARTMLEIAAELRGALGQ